MASLPPLRVRGGHDADEAAVVGDGDSAGSAAAAAQSPHTLKQWRPREELDMYHSLLFIGASGKGKSTIMKKLLYTLRDKFYAVCGMAGNKDVVKDMSKMLHPSMITLGFSPERLRTMMKRGELLMQLQEEQGDEPRPLLVILDDIAALNKAFLKDKTLAEIIGQGRHKGVCVWVLCQHWRQTPSDVRGYSDIILCADDSSANRKALLERFGIGGLDMKQFNTLMNVATQNFGALVARNRASGNGTALQTSVRCYNVTASEHAMLKDKYFRVGAAEVWAVLYCHQKVCKARVSALNMLEREVREWKRDSARKSAPTAAAARGGGGGNFGTPGNELTVEPPEEIPSARAGHSVVIHNSDFATRM